MTEGLAPVLVAGGSGPIGSAIAVVLARRGHQVALHYRSNAARAHEIIASLDGKGHTVIGADLLATGAARELITRAEAMLGAQIGALVNCAWPAHTSRPLGEEGGAELLEQALDGVRAHLALCRAVLPSLRATAGSIVLIGGALSHRLHPGLGYYSLGKAAATTATLTLALEEGAFRVRANVISPGRIDIGQGDLTENDVHYASLDEIGALRRSFDRLPTATDIANVSAFLVSPESASLTGQVISIAGGEPL